MMETAIRIACIAALLCVCGCQTREMESQTVTQDRADISGTADIPGVGPVPIQLQVNRSVSQETRESETTRIDGKAIGASIGSTAGAAIKAAISGATGGAGGVLGDWGTAIAGALTTGAAGAGLWGMNERKKRKRMEQREA